MTVACSQDMQELLLAIRLTVATESAGGIPETVLCSQSHFAWNPNNFVSYNDLLQGRCRQKLVTTFLLKQKTYMSSQSPSDR